VRSSLFQINLILITDSQELSEMQIKEIMIKLDRYTHTFSKLTGPSPTLFLEHICVKTLRELQNGNQMMSNDALVHLQHHITSFDNLRQQVRSLGAELLSLAGYSEETILWQNVNRRISHIVSCLEDLWCHSSEGYQAFRSTYISAELLYQA
jgi:hypothetical protein